MIKVDYELYTALEEAKKFYDFDDNKLLSLHYLCWEDECMLPLNKLSNIELAKLLLEGYELEKVEYKRNTIPKHFKCKLHGGKFHYTADKHKDKFIMMWEDDSNNLCGVIYDIDEIVNRINDGKVIITEIIKEEV